MCVCVCVCVCVRVCIILILLIIYEVYEVYLKVSLFQQYLPRNKQTMNEVLIFFKKMAPFAFESFFPFS